MRVILNKIIELFKWPVAVYMLLSIPAYISSIDYFRLTSMKFLALGAGLLMYLAMRSVADSAVRSNMQTIAHELTHAFFAFITFHKVKHIRLNDDDSGGEMGFEGEGNWLIVISPYFFPLFVFFFMLGASIYLKFAPMNLVINFALGYLLAYHIDTVVSQIHDKQTDLPKVGYAFCWMFLPGANMCMIGNILAFNSLGWKGMSMYNNLIYKLNLRNLDYVIDLIF